MPRNDIKKTLKKHRLSPKKRFGQNFLVHQHIADRIVDLSGVTPEDSVIEVGVGLGALTKPLANRAKSVTGLEVDSGIIRWHEEESDLPDNVNLVHQDILKADFNELANNCGGRIKIIANLPYSISNPFMFKLLENHELIDWAVLMVQKEVGKRLTASAGTKEYGILTVLLGSAAFIKPLMEVAPGNFHPCPKVDSWVIQISFQPVPDHVKALPPFDRISLNRIVNAAFQQRRKTLINSISSANLYNLSKSDIAEVLAQHGISPQIRGEKLTVDDFVHLTNAFENLKKSK